MSRPRSPGHQGEDAEWCCFHDDQRQLHDGFSRAVDDIGEWLAGFARHQDADAEHDGEEDDLQHVAIGQGCDRIGRDDGEQRIHQLFADAARLRVCIEPGFSLGNVSR